MAPTNTNTVLNQPNLAQTLLADRLSLFQDKSPATLVKADLLQNLFPGLIVDFKPFPFPFPTPQPGNTGNTNGNDRLDGLVGQVVDANNDIDKLLGDYQKALDEGKDTFAIQTKIQQAMQRRLELITLLSNIQKMEHDANMAIIQNIR